MTREEAKQMIESMGKYLSEGNPIWEIEPVKEATRMAIEALSKPIVDITQRDLCADISCTDCPFMKETCKLMDYVASAEAAHGEWKRVETRTYKGECTNCGFRHIFMDGHDSQYRFCPNCGAKMTKGGDDE